MLFFVDWQNIYYTIIGVWGQPCRNLCPVTVVRGYHVEVEKI